MLVAISAGTLTKLPSYAEVNNRPAGSLVINAVRQWQWPAIPGTEDYCLAAFPPGHKRLAVIPGFDISCVHDASEQAVERRLESALLDGSIYEPGVA